MFACSDCAPAIPAPLLQAISRRVSPPHPEDVLGNRLQHHSCLGYPQATAPHLRGQADTDPTILCQSGMQFMRVHAGLISLGPILLQTDQNWQGCKLTGEHTSGNLEQILEIASRTSSCVSLKLVVSIRVLRHRELKTAPRTAAAGLRNAARVRMARNMLEQRGDRSYPNLFNGAVGYAGNVEFARSVVIGLH